MSLTSWILMLAMGMPFQASASPERLCEDALYLPVPIHAATEDSGCDAACVRAGLEFVLGVKRTELSLLYPMENLARTFGSPESLQEMFFAYNLNAIFQGGMELEHLPQLLRNQELAILGIIEEGISKLVILKGIDGNKIRVMDPLVAREYRDNIMTLGLFKQRWTGLVLRVSRGDIAPIQWDRRN